MACAVSRFSLIRQNIKLFGFGHGRPKTVLQSQAIFLPEGELNLQNDPCAQRLNR